MRVLTAIETLGAGGAERALIALLPALMRRGHECDVAMLHGPSTLAGELEAVGIRVHDLRLRHRWDAWRGIVGVGRTAKGFDVVHAHGFFAGFYAAASRPATRPARVVTFHNLGYDSFPATSTWLRTRKRADAWLMRHEVDRRTAVSRAVADHYLAHLRLPEVEVIPNGFDVDALAAIPRDRTVLTSIGADPHRPTLVGVGRFVPEKATERLVDALARVRAAGVDAQLVLVGDGPRRSIIERAAAPLGGAVILAGARPHDETCRIVAAADVFVSSSTHEGFPLSPAEAMAVGTPVVATAVGGIPEQVGDAGVLVAADDDAALAAAILDVVRDDARRGALADAGRRRVGLFSVDAVAARLEAVYVDAVARRAR